jgi:putative molybdopterin biosynthesis protein
MTMSKGGDRSDPALAQAQFLTILSREEAWTRWTAALRSEPLGRETVPLAEALGRVAARSVPAPIDNPPFDRSGVDGFAVRAADVAEASARRPVVLRLNAETITCGHAPRVGVAAGTATAIATGAPLPRGADAVIMIEWTEPAEGCIAIHRPAAPGAFVSFAASDIARGETILRAGIRIGAREVAVLAACGVASVEVWRRPRIAVLSTGDELVPPGTTLAQAQVYDCNGPAVAAALVENGCVPTLLPPLPDDRASLAAAFGPMLAAHDGLVISAGTSKGAGDLTYRLIADLGPPGIIAHGVALKPGKPLCLAVCGGKPVVALPGFPTSAMFTFHDMVVPVLRRLAGLPEREEASVEAALAVDIGSELGRREYVMVALLPGAEGIKAFPVGKGSGAVTSFTHADGFVAVDALVEHVAAGSRVSVTRFGGREARVPDLVIIGSHCTGMEIVCERLAALGLEVRSIAAGSQGGLAALGRGEADVAPIHLFDAATGAFNAPFLDETMRLIGGTERMQGIVYRCDDERFKGRTHEEALAAALGDPGCMMVSRNAGAGTRILIDRLLAGRRPPGYANTPRSHNAVAASVAQGRADWGVAIVQAAKAYGLGFIPIGPEHYDFAVRKSPRRPDLIAAFETVLDDPDVIRALAAQGFRLRRA